jgi:hypothetical protein
MEPPPAPVSTISITGMRSGNPLPLPKNIAMFNTHTEALEPMAGALWTSYDASFPAICVKAMKKPSRAGGKPVKARRRKAATLKRRNGLKSVRRRGSAAADHETKVARLARELNEAREQQAATSEVLNVISQSEFDLLRLTGAPSVQAAGASSREVVLR